MLVFFTKNCIFAAVLRYIVKKIGYGLLLMLGVVTLVFFLFNVLPGDPARMMLGGRADQESIAFVSLRQSLWIFDGERLAGCIA